MQKRYSLEAAIPKVAEMLRDKGLSIAINSGNEPNYHLIVNSEDRAARIRICHLQFDENYNNSALPYQVYKIKAYPNGKRDSFTLRSVDFVVGYNPHDGSFACVPAHIFNNQGIACIHQKEGLRHEYYNSWAELNSFTIPTVVQRQQTSREGYDPKTGSDYEFHRDVMEEDDSVERLMIMLEHGTVSDEDKKELIQRFRTNYPQVDKWLNQRADDKPNDEWSRRFGI
ncbi:hypothetical protein PAECIP111893_01215 [Paenibacillus plantiphilus]|uniref:PD(D/E)XK endonuclease domain-containing protein n=1 Tax=Paenibacillus plantiphilus TaxID=2905650 RepID=A0ABM9C011_9BACL|nr:group I intron-associated PD-(D/E)XK endonuclease [Paenibacillus plantiphilus]CAH1199042.1 hypothetical protein PAECIP111893_01215 [Paenibacillus plantiphilus]